MPENPEEYYRIQKLPPYVFAVINEMRAKARAAQIDVIDLGMGNPDGATPRVIVNKLMEASRNARNHRYSQSRGIPALRRGDRGAVPENYDVDLDPEQRGHRHDRREGRAGAPAIRHRRTGRRSSFAESGVPDSSVRRFDGGRPRVHAADARCGDVSGAAGRAIPDLLAQAEDDPDLLPAQSDDDVRGPGFLRGGGELARENDAMIIHDFAYADLGFDGYKPPSILQVPGAKEVAVEIFSMSKSYNMAGWRVGFCLGNQKMIAALARIKSYLDYGVFQPIQIASIIALRECEEDTRKICALYQRRRDVLVTGLKRAGWEVEKPRGSMFLWAPCRSGIGARLLEFAKLLLEKAQVAVSPGIGFGPMGEGHVRFALIENDQRIRQACRAIGAFLKSDA